MILADTSIWIDFLRMHDNGLRGLLDAEQVVSHPWVIGELAVGNLGSGRQRAGLLKMLKTLKKATVARTDEILTFIDRHQLFGVGISYVDVHLIMSAHLTPGTRLWTRDKRLRAAAERLGVAAAHDPMH